MSRAAAFGLLLLLAMGHGGVAARPAVEGVVQQSGDAAVTVRLDRIGVAWRREVKTDIGSTFYQLHFSDIAADEGARFTLRVRDIGNAVIHEVDGATLMKSRDYWTPFLGGRYGLVELFNRGGAGAATVTLKLADIGTEQRGANVLNLQDRVNPKDRPIAAFAGDAALIAAARSVAKLRFQRDGVLLTCTGFLVAERLLLTNHHCFSTAESCATAFALFGHEEDADRVLQPADEFRCERIEDADARLDFTLVTLSGAPGTKWGVLRWQLCGPANGSALYVVQHPGGRPKRVAREGCLVKTASAPGELDAEETDIGHTCDTENGSSGAPLLDLDHQVVGLHHLGFSLNQPRWLKENRAVKAALVHARISRFLQ